MSVEFETKQLDFDKPIENKPTKKRKRKTKYSELMKSAMTVERTEEELAKAHEKQLERSLGGGQFRKIDKI
jgi:protein required for attachment to host cells